MRQTLIFLTLAILLTSIPLAAQGTIHRGQDHPRTRPLIITNTAEVPGSLLFATTQATFAQYILLSLDGRVLANREPLYVVATDVTSWPPVGSTFTLAAATDFYNVGDLDDSDAEPVATLDACAIVVREPVAVPEG